MTKSEARRLLLFTVVEWIGDLDTGRLGTVVAIEKTGVYVRWNGVDSGRFLSWDDCRAIKIH